MKTSTLNTDDFFQGFFNMCKVEDKIFALPFETDCRVLAYNKKLLADANIQPPKTVDEFLAAAKALTKDGVYGFAEPMNKNNWVPIYDTSFMLFGDGGSFVVADGGKYKANLNTPEGIMFLQRSRELYNYMPKDSMGYDYNKFNAAFAQGKVAMSVWGPWIYTTREVLDAKLDYGLTLLPAGSKNSSSTMGGWLLGVSGDSENKDAAFKVAEFLVKPEVNAEVTGALSTSGEAFKYGKMMDEKYKIFADQLKTAIVPFPAGFSASSQVADGFAKDFAKALLTNEKIEDIAKSGNDAIQKAIDSAN
jgi:ABC-type glycerol-3-phosphate transport system substrate-binding protein